MNRPPELNQLAQQLLLECFAPASVLINRKYEILYLSGETDRYLQTAGEPTTDLMSMLREGLATPVRALCRQALQTPDAIARHRARVRRAGAYHPVEASVRSIAEPKALEGLLLVTFEDQPTVDMDTEITEPDSGEEVSVIKQLEYALRTTREDRQSTVEELDTVNRELLDKVEALDGTNSDISARKRLEKQLLELNEELEQRVAERTAEARRRADELQEREHQLSAIVNMAPDAIITVDYNGVIHSFNPAAEVMFGYPASEAIGQNVCLLMPAPYREEHDSYLRRYLETREPRLIGQPKEVRGLRKDGTVFPMELNVTEVDHRGLFIGITRDLTLQKSLEKQIIEVSTQEQERIGHEIHDGLGQQLSALTMMATSVERKLAEKQLAESHDLNALVTHLQQAAAEAHALSMGLAPIPMDPGGLETALHRLAEQVHETAGILCHLSVTGPVTIEDRTRAMQLYRIAQEAANNAVKHARPNNITIELATDARSIRLTVADDGEGIGPAVQDAQGLGMHIMRYRASMIGASLRIESAQAKGTTVTCTLEHPPEAAH